MIYIVIPHYITSLELETLAINTIDSMRHTAKDLFIVSVDDGSTRTVDFLDDISDKVIHMGKNSGFARACNAGFKYVLERATEDDYIVCANNDIEVFDGWLEAMVSPFNEYDKVGVTGLISSMRRYIDGVPIQEYQVQKVTEGGLLDHWMQSGGLWMSKPSVLNKVGLFDERFVIGGEEDVDIFLRIRDKHGYKLIMSGKSCFWHKEGATRWKDDVKEKNKKCEEENYDRFAEKWGFDIRKEGLRFYEDSLWWK